MKNQEYFPQDPLLERLFENAFIPVAFLDTRFNFIRVNQAYAAVDNRKPADFEGKNHFELYPSLENERIFRHVLETGAPHQAIAKPFEYEFNPERGLTHWDWILTPIKNEKETCVGVLLMLRDVSQYIQALSIAEHEQRLSETILDASVELLLVLDKEGRIIRFNKACETLTGYRTEEVLGTYVWDRLIGMDEQESVRAIFDELVNLGQARQCENYWHAKNGHKYRVRWSNSNLKDSDGNVTHIIARGIPVGDTRQNDTDDPVSLESVQALVNERTLALLNAKEEAERSSEFKSSFLKRLNHELRTPMNAILGFLQLLRMNTELPGETLNTMREIQLASEHMQSLISEMHTLDDIESGRINLNLRELSVSQLVSQCVAMISHEASQHDITIVNQVPETSSLRIRADHLRIREVLMNLLSNGIKYNTPGGQLYIGAAMAGPDFVQISVRDTGKGITRHEQQQIFANASRLGAEYTDIQGSGLGLGIAKQLLELQGGILSVQSEFGKGSTFYMKCPASSPKDSRHDSEDTVRSETGLEPQKPFRVLYIENNPADARLVETMLRKEPVEFIHAGTGEKGLKLAQSHEPALIILCLNQPGIDGYDILSALKKDARTGNACILALSADAQPHDIEKALSAGFSSYLSKPINVAGFLALVRRQAGLNNDIQ